MLAQINTSNETRAREPNNPKRSANSETPHTPPLFPYNAVVLPDRARERSRTLSISLSEASPTLLRPPECVGGFPIRLCDMGFPTIDFVIGRTVMLECSGGEEAIGDLTGTPNEDRFSWYGPGPGPVDSFSPCPPYVGSGR